MKVGGDADANDPGRKDLEESDDPDQERRDWDRDSVGAEILTPCMKLWIKSTN